MAKRALTTFILEHPQWMYGSKSMICIPAALTGIFSYARSQAHALWYNDAGSIISS